MFNGRTCETLDSVLLLHFCFHRTLCHLEFRQSGTQSLQKGRTLTREQVRETFVLEYSNNKTLLFKSSIVNYATIFEKHKLLRQEQEDVTHNITLATHILCSYYMHKLWPWLTPLAIQ